MRDFRHHHHGIRCVEHAEGHEGRRGGRGGGGGGRVFGHGGLRFVLLQLIADKPSHGYELIKAIEERLGGAYSPSPGTVYPTLTLLEELGYVSVGTADEGGRKRYTVTTAGQD
ncbi:MAG: PadR family transcriptional regulator, partial [Comamonadaceae bacterium]